MDRILVVGCRGQLGRELMQAPWPETAEIVGRDLPDIDIAEPMSVESAFEEVAPTLVVNAAAYTQVDRAEDEPDAAFAANHLGCAHLAASCQRLRAPLVHLSTDYVFGGEKTTPYVETDAPHPLGVYGASKLAGERAIRERLAAHLILRTSWLFGAVGPNFVETMLRLGGEREEVRVVDDQIGCPTPADDLATAIARLGGRVLRGDAVPWGIYHFAGRGETSWHGLAREVFDRAASLGRPSPRLISIPTTDYPTRARRPAYTALDCTLFEETFSIPALDWRPGLDRVLRALLQGSAPPQGS